MKALTAADLACAILSEGQHGVIGREQALDLGMTPTAISDRLRTSKWIEIHPCVYRLAGVPVTPLLKIMAAWLWAQEGFISHRSAAELYQLDGIDTYPRVELSAYSGRSRAGLLVHRLQLTDQPTPRLVHGIPTSPPERVLFELAGILPLHLAGLALDDALRRRLTTLDRVWNEWETRGKRGRKGTRKLKILLMSRDDREGLLRSRLEAKMLRILKRIGGHEVVPNLLVRAAGRTAYLDFAYPDLKVAIETHGARWHAGDEHWKKDLRRDRWLKKLGWTVLYFSWDDVHLASREVEEEIRTFLNDAA